jgi:thiamine-phosphate pyrophosphorylase
MTRRQSIPEQWLIVDGQADGEQWQALGKLARGSGVLLLQALCAKDRRRLRHLAGARELVVVVEGFRTAVRVHNQHELTRAMGERAALVLVSPLHPTRSHPDWKPLPRMRAATLARLSGRRRAIALGGMNRQRYGRIAPLGYIGWAGISAFRT